MINSVERATQRSTQATSRNARGTGYAGALSALSIGFNALRGLGTKMRERSQGRRLHVSETISLGEKRFVAIISVDGERLLVGGSASSVALLARLGPAVLGETRPQSVDEATPSECGAKASASPGACEPGREMMPA